MRVIVLPFVLSFMLLLPCFTAAAGNIGEELKQNTTFSGYVIGSFNANTRSHADKNADMAVRLARFIVSSRIGDWELKLQAQLNGNTSSLSSPRIVDASAEWQHWKEFKVKAGQFKRPFTFDNPTNPWNIGLGSFSQLADRLAGFNDRVGEHPSNGRDIGIQVQGDLFPARGDGHRWLHYQAGVFNGQGINHLDKNSRKDIIGGLWLMPLSDLRIGAFGWTGDYVVNDSVTQDRNRMAFGVSYRSTWVAEAEWAVDADHVDAWYVKLGRTLSPQLKVFARWNVYRKSRAWSDARSLYELAANYYFHPNLMLQANYAYHVDKSRQGDQRFNSLDVQLYWRF
ncbi:MAG: porin [Bacteroidaceae bacterium]|nr:porin [Bacteroidaceae bacterium]